eukprot:gene9586-8487_t
MHAPADAAPQPLAQPPPPGGAAAAAAAAPLQKVGAYVSKAQRTRNFRAAERDAAAAAAGAQPAPKETFVERRIKKATESAVELVGKDMVETFKDQLKGTEGRAQRGARDKVIISMLQRKKFTVYHLQNAFSIGFQRIERLVKEHPDLAPPTSRKTDDVKLDTQEFVIHIKSEQGF